MPTYAVRAPLVHWLGEQAEDAHGALGRYRVLDVGCGAKPYDPLCSPHAASYIGVDPVDIPRAELKGSVEALPVDDDRHRAIGAEVGVGDPSASLQDRRVLHEELVPDRVSDLRVGGIGDRARGQPTHGTADLEVVPGAATPAPRHSLPVGAPHHDTEQGSEAAEIGIGARKVCQLERRETIP